MTTCVYLCGTAPLPPLLLPPLPLLLLPLLLQVKPFECSCLSSSSLMSQLVQMFSSSLSNNLPCTGGYTRGGGPFYQAAGFGWRVAAARRSKRRRGPCRLKRRCKRGAG